MRQWNTNRHNELPTDWLKRRAAVFTRDNYTCVDCGWHDPTMRTLECDHTGDRNDHHLDQLVTRCGRNTPNNCHGKHTSAQGHAARLRYNRQPEQHPGLR